MHFVSVAISFLTLLTLSVVADDDAVQKCNSKDFCIYPSHSVPSCKSHDPCAFTCKHGYGPWPTTGTPLLCKCNWPSKVCPDGKCAKSCPSGHSYKRNFFERQCRAGFTACRIPGRGARSWECLNTQADLESCGGCVIPLHPGSPEGIDCTAIEHMSDVSCNRGKCVVHRCRPGYEISNDGHSCVDAVEESSILLAAQYGLEHLRVGAL